MNQSQKGHMNSKYHDRFGIHEKEKNDNDSSWQPKCNILNKKILSTTFKQNMLMFNIIMLESKLKMKKVMF